MEFTKEEISLCKQVAEKHRKPIKCGDWMLKNGKLVLNLDGKLAWSDDKRQDIIITITSKLRVIPLWTIPDCLEFLARKHRILTVEVVWNFVKFKVSISIRPYGTYHGNTSLEAYLKAVLAVLEDK